MHDETRTWRWREPCNVVAIMRIGIAVVLLATGLLAGDALAGGGRVVDVRVAARKKVLLTDRTNSVKVTAPASERVTKDGRSRLGFTRTRPVTGKPGPGNTVTYDLAPGVYNVTRPRKDGQQRKPGRFFRKVDTFMVIGGAP